MTAKLADQLTFARGPAMPNRMMLAPLTNWQSAEDGTLSDTEFHWLTMRAKGGFGLTMTCAAHVHELGKAFPGQLGVWNDGLVDGLTRLSAALKAHGGLSSVQIHHGGERRADEYGGSEVVAPFADEKLGSRAMTTAEVKEAIQSYIDAAVRAEKAGFDGVEIHGAHGYLLCQFLHPDKNLRTDGYGTSYEGRTRIYREVIDGIRAATGPDFQLGLRLSPERFGITIAESTQLAEEVMTSGKLDYLDMSLWDCFIEPREEAHKGKSLIDIFAALPRGNCRLGVAGKIMSAATAQACLDHGADFVLIGRGAMLHHDFAARALKDAAFESVPLPVTRTHFANEGLSEQFIDYVQRTWPNYIAA